MRLHDFILTNRESILREWEAFARTCSPASVTMGVEALRDHANAMLTVIARDLTTAQGRRDQSDKSKGLAPPSEAAPPTAAEEHGAGRAGSGFTVAQMVAEYRALRASVLRLWTTAQGELGPAEIDDLVRFNEAVDQALAESIAEFDRNVEQAKEMFLAILGHDMRTPLGAIYTSAQYLLDMGELEEPRLTLMSRIATSATRAVQMVGDLLDFTRGRLGGGIPVVRKHLSLGKVVHDVVEEISAAHPERTIQFEARQEEEEEGEWDAARLAQAVTNLIANAVEHGTPGTPVAVEVRGDGENVAIAIQNRGAIPADQLDGLFNPMKVRAPQPFAADRGPTANLGLGLYIAERIVHAHGGRIEVGASESAGTTFTVHLPRRA